LQQAPEPPAMTKSASEADKQTQEERAKKYGIGIKEGGHVTKPAAFAQVPDEEFADPTNFRYPMHDKAHADNAASRWGDADNRSEYSSKEQSIISKRIEAAQKKFGEEKEGQPDVTKSLTINADGSHEKYTGTHTHAHHAYGSQGDDGQHEHEHGHNDD